MELDGMGKSVWTFNWAYLSEHLEYFSGDSNN